MSDLISRCELFNRLATIPAPPEANDLKAEIYKVIQSMDVRKCEDCKNADFSGCAETRIYCLEHGCYMSRTDCCNYWEAEQCVTK